MKDVSTDEATAESLTVEGKGVNYGTRPRLDPESGTLNDAAKILYEGNEAVGVTAEALPIGGQHQHIGVILKGTANHSDMASFFTHPFKAVSQGYLSFGISHQAVNISLLNAGYGTTINSIGGGWSSILSTFVYGPYGGGLTGAVTYDKVTDE